jgi:hypothetical protein
MKKLLEKKAALEKEMDAIIRTADQRSSEGRSKMIAQSRLLHGKIHEIEKMLDRQRAKLGRLLHEVLDEVRSLAEAGSQQQLLALLDSVGDLPHQMFDSQGFEWDALRQALQNYQQRHHPTKHDYVRLLDEIRSSA